MGGESRAMRWLNLGDRRPFVWGMGSGFVRESDSVPRIYIYICICIY